jgi:hypothetical protein
MVNLPVEAAVVEVLLSAEIVVSALPGEEDLEAAVSAVHLGVGDLEGEVSPAHLRLEVEISEMIFPAGEEAAVAVVVAVLLLVAELAALWEVAHRPSTISMMMP